jgi:hypothetical protein
MIKASQFKTKRSAYKISGIAVYYYSGGDKNRTFFKDPKKKEKQSVIKIVAKSKKISKRRFLTRL